MEATPEKVVIKCSRPRAGAVVARTFCPSLALMLNNMANRGKGLSETIVMSISTGQERTIGVVYRRKSSDRGVMLNFCPFCAQPILWTGLESP